MNEVVLHDYWHSSAAYRVRIALNLKGIDYRAAPVDLLEGGQSGEAYLAVNPQGLVPALEIDGLVIAQSLAIIDYLDARFEQPRLIPADPAERAQVLSQVMVVAADIHPLNNLRVQKYLRSELGAGDAQVKRWIHHWIAMGFAALETAAPDEGFFGGNRMNLADVFLVPQMFNARRFDVALEAFPRLVRIDAAACELAPVAAAAPRSVRPA